MQVESLKYEVSEKSELLGEASQAIELLETRYQDNTLIKFALRLVASQISLCPFSLVVTGWLSVMRSSLAWRSACTRWRRR